MKTVTETMVADDRGYLWVQTVEEQVRDGNRLTAYDIFDRDGLYDTRVWLDLGGDFHSALFKQRKLYMLRSDENTGLRTLKRYAVRWLDR